MIIKKNTKKTKERLHLLSKHHFVQQTDTIEILVCLNCVFCSRNKSGWPFKQCLRTEKETSTS